MAKHRGNREQEKKNVDVQGNVETQRHKWIIS
jgi:hypothetical protein